MTNENDLIRRADAIEAVCDVVMDEFNTSATWGYDVAEKALSALPSADAKPTMTEEVREALMRLTMCAREECGMCKYKDECGFDFQYKISTDNMNTILNALSAEAVPLCDDCTRCTVNALNRPSAEAVQGEWIEKGGELVCSVCGNSVSFSRTPKGWVLGRFCQTCGAKMTKDGEDE